MKFDSSRAEAVFRDLGAHQYAGPDSEAKIADFVASQFAEMGLDVKRRELVGSRRPPRTAGWAGWLTYGVVLSAVYGLILPGAVLTTILALILLTLSFYWLGAVLEGRIRLGRARPALISAPVVIASLRDGRPTADKVVFQAVLGGLSPEAFHPARRGYLLYPLSFVAFVLFYCEMAFQIYSFFGIRVCGFLLPDRVASLVTLTSLILVRQVLPGILVLVWAGIVGIVLWETHQLRRKELPTTSDRRGLAILLELARTWPRTGSRPIEPVFLAAGGHGLEHPGSRDEFVRFLKAEPSRDRSILVLFAEPGAGDKLSLFTVDSLYANLHELARCAAQDLWLPIQVCESLPSYPLLPFGVDHPAVVVIGSDPRTPRGDSFDAQGLQRAAQLATEIALRWGKQQRAAPPPGSAV
jgi:hypothetical protein